MTLKDTGRTSSSSKGSPNRPRLCSPEERLKSRFYEPLVLLHVLDRNGGQRISRCPSGELEQLPHLTLRELRRAFLEQLAYVCDHIKGGDTVTAMALESKPPGRVLWVACNNNFSAKMKFFLEGILSILQSLALSEAENSKSATEDEVTELCINFNLKRIKIYQTLMLQPLRRCLKILASSQEEADKSLANWLKSFRNFNKDLPGLCRYAYQQRSSPYLKELRRHIGDELCEITEVPSTRQAFLLTRHFIGRLGSHLKASKILIMAGLQLPNLFSEFTIQTLPSPRPASTPPPTDNLTTLKSIVGRMISNNENDVLRYQETLTIMDTKFGIQERLLATYKDEAFKPRVHAELNLLEHFYKNRLEFEDNDRFIGCSKPACYCCYHYITLHPGGFVRPSSHGIRYLSWRPPDLADDTDLEKKHQRDVMNKVTAQVRGDALRQIDQYTGPSPWRPDSSTGITHSLNREVLKPQTGFSQAQKVAIDNTLGPEQQYEIPDLTNLALSQTVTGGESSDSDGGVSL